MCHIKGLLLPKRWPQQCIKKVTELRSSVLLWFPVWGFFSHIHVLLLLSWYLTLSLSYPPPMHNSTGSCISAACNDSKLSRKALWLNIWEPVTAGAIACHFHWLLHPCECLSMMSHSWKILSLPIRHFYGVLFALSFSPLSSFYCSLHFAKPSGPLSWAHVCL